MPKKRKICVVTGSRADYGLLYWTIKAIHADKDLALQIIVTGMHLSHEFGLTYRRIEEDGFKIDKKVEILLSSDTSMGVCKSMGLAHLGYAEALSELNPDIVLLLGDRFEILPAASCAQIYRIPVAHIHGGEVTVGAFDDAFRHSITKMSHIHFTSTNEYRRRIIQLGENPDRVFNVGAPGIDNIKRLKLLSKASLESKIQFTLGKKSILVTFHPETLEPKSAEKQFGNLLQIINGYKDLHAIFTKANADTEGRTINRMIDSFVTKNQQRCIAFASMGQLQYLSTLKHIDAVVGNSSSGIIEAPAFKIGTINIGDRQKGRIKADSVIDCEPTKDAIMKAFRKLYSNKFQSKLKFVKNPYGEGGASEKIKKIIKGIDLSEILKKEFFDLESGMR